MLTGFRFLESVNINTLVQTLQTELEMARPLTFLSRLPVVNAEDDEIFGRYSGQVFAADIIADDQEAVIYEGGSMETFRSGAIPKLKMGARIGEGQIRKLARLSQNLTLSAPDQDLITGWENQLARRLVEGLRVRQNVMACAMMLDDFVYDRLGMKLQGTWGTPSDLKVVKSGTGASGKWAADGTGAVNALSTPLTDIATLQQVALDTYGQAYDRITMSRKAFSYIVQTDEFFQRAKFQYRFDLPTGSLNTNDVVLMSQLFETMTGLKLEIEDTTYRTRSADGINVSTRVLPINKVILSNSADDGNDQVMDFANGVVIESVVAPIFNHDAAASFGGENYGPFSYYTGNSTLNPPDLSAWAVIRGFPRKHMVTATAVITGWVA